MKQQFFTSFFWFLAVCLFVNINATAQSQTTLDIALRYLENNYKSYDLTSGDISDLVVSDIYKSNHNGVTHIYLKQRSNEIEVYNAIFNLNIKDGKVFHTGNRFITGLYQKVNTASPSITAAQAVQKTLADLGFPNTNDLRLKEQLDENAFVFEKGNYSYVDIPVQLSYQPLENGEVRLAWDLSIDQVGGNDYWSVRVDAQTGAILDKISWTVHCSFAPGMYHNHDAECRDHSKVINKKALSMEKAMEQAQMMEGGVLAGSYNVFAEYDGDGNLHPHESPNHGDRNLIADPEDLTASPYGWHDTNGSSGAEFTITRGNNVHAYLDVNDTNSSSGDEPDGGSSLVFDFNYDVSLNPDLMQDVAVTNLFFMNNMIHDFSYAYGFNEAAGNFQQNNYGNGGAGGDFVRAEAQDGGGTNNANFATPPDGGNGRMQMYLWNNGAGWLEVTSPGTVIGGYDTGLANGWGAGISDPPASGTVVIAEDGIENPYFTDACEEITNDVAGKIAIIDRGGCEFGSKALRAEQKGAIAVIICNFEDEVIGMAPGDDGGQVTIPVVFISNSDCNLIREFAGEGLEATVGPPQNSGPEFIDGDFDNGIIAHEFAHGISNRLTGGPSQAGCLGNTEQMGEGWSDFFSLVTTVKPGDTGDMRRGIGTYAIAQNTTGNGIRSYPYSTSLDENPHAFADIVGESVPHGVGSVWCAMLWEMYWAFVDEYGFDPDLYHGTGGNNMAVQLVMDGMKLQPCSPGFIEGRDAILAADQALYDGANQCLIWEAFAKRGLGYFAEGGSDNAVGDEDNSFEPLPTCIAKLKVSKTVTDFVEPGEKITVTINVINHKPETLTNVVVNDEIPAGASFVAGSASNNGFEQGGLVIFELGTVEYLDEFTLTYELETDINNPSIRYYIDDIEDGDDNWDLFAPNGADIWQISDITAFSGDFSWFVEATEAENHQIVQTADPLTIIGNNTPVLRFYNRYNTEVGADGGIVEVSTNGGDDWIDLGDKMFRNGYDGGLAYGTLAIPNLSAFYGNSGGYIPTYVDLSDYKNQDVLIRFRFASDESTTVGGIAGWSVDDFELQDMVSYNGEVCVTSDQGDEACAVAESRGTIVNSVDGVVNTEEAFDDQTQFSVFPNPAKDLINVAFSGSIESDVRITMFTLEGRSVYSTQLELHQNQQILPINVSSLPAGIYFIQMNTGKESVVEKVVLR